MNISGCSHLAAGCSSACWRSYHYHANRTTLSSKSTGVIRTSPSHRLCLKVLAWNITNSIEEKGRPRKSFVLPWSHALAKPRGNVELLCFWNYSTYSFHSLWNEFEKDAFTLLQLDQKSLGRTMQSREMMKTQLVSCSHVSFIRETERSAGERE